VEVQMLTGEESARGISQETVAGGERLNVDVLRMGTHGCSGLRNVLLGSVTREVMQRADQPGGTLH
jgi:nucleotide-binding universal stress UspA family protein